MSSIAALLSDVTHVSCFATAEDGCSPQSLSSYVSQNVSASTRCADDTPPYPSASGVCATSKVADLRSSTEARAPGSGPPGKRTTPDVAKDGRRRAQVSRTDMAKSRMTGLQRLM